MRKKRKKTGKKPRITHKRRAGFGVLAFCGVIAWHYPPPRPDAVRCVRAWADVTCKTCLKVRR